MSEDARVIEDAKLAYFGDFRLNKRYGDLLALLVDAPDKSVMQHVTVNHET